MSGSLATVREHIVATPDTCGGRPRIAGTRIRVKDVVIWHIHLELSPAEIVSRWPHLTLASVYAALSYYHDHREELNTEIAADLERCDGQHSSHASLVRQKLHEGETPDAPDDSFPPR